MRNPIKVKYNNKKFNSIKEDIEFLLTFENYCYLLNDANITVNDIGPNKYHLSRYNDSGPYEIGNCRFLHYLDNIKEKKISEKSRLASSKNMKKICERRSIADRKKFSALGGLKGGGHNKLTKEEINKRIKLINNSKIDLLKYGCISKIAKLLSVSHTHARRFVNKHYNKNVYNRADKTILN